VYVINIESGNVNYVPGLLLDWKLLPDLWGRKTPVPHDFWPESRKKACIPGPPDAQLPEYLGF